MILRAFFAIFLLAGAAGHAQEKLRPDVPVAIVGGMLIDGRDTVSIHHSVVVFENGRITAVGKRDNTPVPRNAVVIDAGGRTVMPGMVRSMLNTGLPVTTFSVSTPFIGLPMMV